MAVLRDDAVRLELDDAEREALAVHRTANDALPDPLRRDPADVLEGAQSADPTYAALVLISSTVGIGAGAGYAAYYSCKHGVIGLMRTLANEAGEEIQVNAVCPGWVDTPVVAAQAAVEASLLARTSAA
jgi:NAD(P)-dependent dehydrogenase (short-subunit alcohol dehydrogenase family)